MSIDEVIHHLALFVSRLWQIHIFSEGNTRTTAVFFIKYLRTLGFDATNDIFAEHAWYFRNALVRANYNDLKNGIYETTEFLELFLRNLLLGEENELRNRALHLRRAFQNYKKPNIGTEKPNIDSERLYVEDVKTVYTGSRREFTKKTVFHIKKMYAAFGVKSIFGRSDAEAVLGLKATSTSELLKKLLEAKIIKPVSGYGKGKYRFSEIEVLEVLCGKQ